MPFSILSHQAPGLALKIRFPKKFDGTGKRILISSLLYMEVECLKSK